MQGQVNQRRKKEKERLTLARKNICSSCNSWILFSEEGTQIGLFFSFSSSSFLLSFFFIARSRLRKKSRTKATGLLACLSPSNPKNLAISGGRRINCYRRLLSQENVLTAAADKAKRANLMNIKSNFSCCKSEICRPNFSK